MKRVGIVRMGGSPRGDVSLVWGLPFLQQSIKSRLGLQGPSPSISFLLCCRLLCPGLAWFRWSFDDFPELSQLEKGRFVFQRLRVLPIGLEIFRYLVLREVHCDAVSIWSQTHDSIRTIAWGIRNLFGWPGTRSRRLTRGLSDPRG